MSKMKRGLTTKRVCETLLTSTYLPHVDDDQIPCLDAPEINSTMDDFSEIARATYYDLSRIHIDDEGKLHLTSRNINVSGDIIP